MYLHCLRPGETGDIWESPVTNVTERWERRESGNTLREGSLLAGAVDVDKSPSLKLKLYWLRLRSMKNAPRVAVTGRQNIPHKDLRTRTRPWLRRQRTAAAEETIPCCCMIGGSIQHANASSNAILLWRIRNCWRYGKRCVVLAGSIIKGYK